MFGLDDAIASLTGSGSLPIVILVAVALGLRHATDPDHLAAVMTLVASGRERSGRRAAGLGVAWGAGHATTLFLFGLPVVLFRAYLPDPVQHAAEASVGILIIGLAFWLLARWRRGLLHVHEHGHDDEPHAHAHAHPHSHLRRRGHAHGHRTRSRLGAFAIGLVHGIGGSAGVGVLLVASIDSRGYAVAALVTLAVFTGVSMTLLTAAVGRGAGGRLIARRFDRLAPALGCASLAFGLWYVLGALQLAPYAF